MDTFCIHVDTYDLNQDKALFPHLYISSFFKEQHDLQGQKLFGNQSLHNQQIYLHLLLLAKSQSKGLKLIQSSVQPWSRSAFNVVIFYH